MFQPASVSLSGPAFSFLLYETCKGSVRQNGFLLGDIIHKEITSITDNDQKQVDISKIIKINSAIPCPSNSYFVRGRVDKERLRKFLGSSFTKVVAWYKYESSPTEPVKFTLKDRALHKQFRELFDVPQDLFSCCCLSMACTDNFSTYKFQQNFVRYANGSFDRLSIYIPNLSQSNNTYKNSEPASEVFNKILSSIKMDIESIKGIVAVTEIENAVQNYIIKTTSELAKAERYLYELEDEVKVLQLENPLSQSRIEVVKAESSDDMFSFEEPQNNSQPENSPELTRKSSRIRTSRTSTNSSPGPDSNKKETRVQNDLQHSPEAQKKHSPARQKAPRGRGKSKKKV